MTSTNFNVGLNTDSRLTSRVLKPPGGGHTDIFGHAEPEAPKSKKQNASSIVIGSYDEEKTNNGHAPREVAPLADANENSDVPAPPPAEPKVDNEKQQQHQQEPARAEAPKRVRVPPGGFSSGLW